MGLLLSVSATEWGIENDKLVRLTVQAGR